MVADVELTATIRTIHAASRETYGVPRVTVELLLGLERPVNRKRVARLTASADLRGSPDAKDGGVRSATL